MTRRAFTLLETMLAMVVGILVLTAAMGVMSAIRSSDAMLSVRATHQRELAGVRAAVSSALDRIRPAPNNIVRDVMGQGVEEEDLRAIYDVAYPEPVPGLAHHFELSDASGLPRLEVVVDRPPMGTFRADESRTDERVPVDGDDLPGVPASEGGVLFGSADLSGYRGAFELRESAERDWAELWWVPLPPANVPEGLTFDTGTLAEPTLLCAHVAELRWTAFIDSSRTPRVRAIESRQLPAYVELELRTTEGVYANWMFELGWITGAEVEIAPPESDEPPADAPVPPAEEQIPFPDRAPPAQPMGGARG